MIKANDTVNANRVSYLRENNPEVKAETPKETPKTASKDQVNLGGKPSLIKRVSRDQGRQWLTLLQNLALAPEKTDNLEGKKVYLPFIYKYDHTDRRQKIAGQSKEYDYKLTNLSPELRNFSSVERKEDDGELYMMTNFPTALNQLKKANMVVFRPFSWHACSHQDESETQTGYSLTPDPESKEYRAYTLYDLQQVTREITGVDTPPPGQTAPELTPLEMMEDLAQKAAQPPQEGRLVYRPIARDNEREGYRELDFSQANALLEEEKPFYFEARIWSQNPQSGEFELKPLQARHGLEAIREVREGDDPVKDNFQAYMPAPNQKSFKGIWSLPLVHIRRPQDLKNFHSLTQDLNLLK